MGFSARTPEDNAVVVPAGYTAVPLIKWGDPLSRGLSDFDPQALTAAEQAQRFGYNCDFVAFLPLPRRSRRPDRGLLWVNHESTEEALMFSDWKEQTERHVGVGLAAHGGSVLEVRRRRDGSWMYDAASPFNRRVTATTPMVLTGPAAGHEWLRTRTDHSGRRVLGTLANCSGGVTPWGTILTAEENFDHYFPGMDAVDKPYFKRSRDRGWQKHDDRFDVKSEPHEPFRFGWIVEIDPYDPDRLPKKRTALGRFKHEAAVTVVSADGRPVVYSGDDEELQYVYKFVASGRLGRRADENILDHGTLYAARFEADGTGSWLPLVYGSDPLDRPAFTSQAHVLIRAREAARALNATQMDRPEDIEVSPQTGCVYMSMTKNEKREVTDAANPRPENKFGHVIELTEDGDDPAATRFRWEIFLLCGHPEDLVTDPHGAPLRPETSYFAGYGDREHLSPIATPDNLVFDDVGNLWIATDGQEVLAKAGAPAPGNDALHVVPTEGEGRRGHVQRFLSAPLGAEVTGPCFSPDFTALFVAIQQHGEKPQNTWPPWDRPLPRPAVVVVTKDDGGVIGT